MDLTQKGENVLDAPKNFSEPSQLFIKSTLKKTLSLEYSKETLKSSNKNFEEAWKEKNFGNKHRGYLMLHEEIKNDLFSHCLTACRLVWESWEHFEYNHKIQERFDKLVELVFRKAQYLLSAVLDEDYKKWLALLQVGPSHSEQVYFQNLANSIAIIASSRKDSQRRQEISKICDSILEVSSFSKF